MQYPLWTVDAMSSADAASLLATARLLKRDGAARAALRGKQLALLSDAPDSPAARAFADAAAVLGARVSTLRPADTLVDDPRDGATAARLLGRLYDAIGCDVSDPARLARLARDSEVPVLNLPVVAWHPTRLLGDLLSMQETEPLPLPQLRLCVRGAPEGAWPVAWRRVGLLTGLQVCFCESKPQAHLEHPVDFVSDPDLGPRCDDGHPALQHGRLGVPIAQTQKLNHGYAVQALLAHALH